MRISQLKSLNESEINLLLYIVKVAEPISLFEINKPSDLLWIHHDDLLFKISCQESKLTDEGKEIFKGLMVKLNKTTDQEREEYENSTKPEFTQSEFQF